jgi:exodeoxyribonuclease X
MVMLAKEAHFLVLDTETTGLDSNEDKVVELAATQVYRGQVQGLFSTLIDPGRPIPPEASVVHHLTERDVAGKPSLATVWPHAVEKHIQDWPRPQVFVAHNATFDKQFLPTPPGVLWLCTKRLAQKVWPEVGKYQNQYLRYWLKLDLDVGMPHRALADTLVTGHLLVRILQEIPEDMTVEALVAWADAPNPVLFMPFGKHKGQPLRKIPKSYVEWLLENGKNLDEDLRFSLEACARSN